MGKDKFELSFKYECKAISQTAIETLTPLYSTLFPGQKFKDLNPADSTDADHRFHFIAIKDSI
jgi:hypothetical protein